MRIVKQKRGQFIIIAALLVAIMMVSVSTIMYSAVTYYRHERWEEYLSIIDNVKIGSQRVVEISLANYTSNNCEDKYGTILRNNLQQWVNDTKKAYAGFGINLSYSLTEDEKYKYGLAHDWNEDESFSAADATFTLGITSAGLSGYQFTTPVLLGVKIIKAVWSPADKELTISFTVYKEDSMFVTNLKKNNFRLNGTDIEKFTVVRYYDATYEGGAFIYDIYCSQEEIGLEPPYLISVAVIDARSIKVVANVTVPT